LKKVKPKTCSNEEAAQDSNSNITTTKNPTTIKTFSGEIIPRITTNHKETKEKIETDEQRKKTNNIELHDDISIVTRNTSRAHKLFIYAKRLLKHSTTPGEILLRSELAIL
jgi:hypothetical protein